MGEADFPGLRVGTATNEGHLRDGVMRCTERTLRDEARVAAQLASDRVYLRRLQALGQREWWQDTWQTLGEHRLTAARRAYHNKNMSDYTGTQNA